MSRRRPTITAARVSFAAASHPSAPERFIVRASLRDELPPAGLR
jgi:hypothetical protein